MGRPRRRVLALFLQLDAVAPAFAPRLRLDRKVLGEWADFDARIGIVSHRPDVARAFDFGMAGG
jgi:hypothetical protein